MSLHDVLIRPIISEQSMGGLTRDRYTFEVKRNATKTEIKNAVEHIFKVHVVSVNTMRTPGKLRRMGRYSGYTPEVKKAIVTLKAGSKIEFFEGLV